LILFVSLSEQTPCPFRSPRPQPVRSSPCYLWPAPHCTLAPLFSEGLERACHLPGKMLSFRFVFFPKRIPPFTRSRLPTLRVRIPFHYFRICSPAPAGGLGSLCSRDIGRRVYISEGFFESNKGGFGPKYPSVMRVVLNVFELQERSMLAVANPLCER
jgi:hypothetical protein